MTVPFLVDADFTLYIGDALTVLRELDAESVHCVVTSPPYWGLRDYGAAEQLGLEATPEEYVAKLVTVFREVRRVLRRDGTCWLNIGDSYTPSGGYLNATNTLAAAAEASDGRARNRSGPRSQTQVFARGKAPELKPKDLIGIPWRVAFALQADGWFLRSDIIWSKPNPMPESATDRPTKAHEYVFLLTSSARYFYDADAIKEPHKSTRWGGRYSEATDGWKGGSRIHEREHRDYYPEGGRNKRTVWEIVTENYPEAHFATFPQALVEPCIKAGCPAGGVVLDPFIGSGTTALVARRLGRRCVGIELNREYVLLAAERTHQLSLFAGASA